MVAFAALIETVNIDRTRKSVALDLRMSDEEGIVKKLACERNGWTER